MTSEIVVARRELIDLVDRVLRIDGVDPGDARRLTRAVAHGHAGGHDAVTALLAMVDGGGVDDLLGAYDEIAAGELTARRDGSAQVELANPAPQALLVGPLAESAGRGVVRVTSSSVEGLTSAIGLEHRPEASPAHPEQRHELRLTRELFDELTRRAQAFLVAESLLDSLPVDATA